MAVYIIILHDECYKVLLCGLQIDTQKDLEIYYAPRQIEENSYMAKISGFR